MRNRIILFCLIALIWFALKVADYLVSGPQLLILISVAVAIMLSHSLWLFGVQKKSQAKLAAAKLTNNQTWQPWVDILISAKNESRVIESTIRNFLKLDYDKFNIWVINDCSTDNTADVLQSLEKEISCLKVINRIPGCQAGKSAALNEALPLTRGEAIAVFDADAYINSDFLKLVLPLLEPEGIGAVQAQKRIYEQQKGFLINCQSSEYALDTYFQEGRDLIGGAVELRGNGQVIKRSALIDVGGWNNRAITDDLDLSMRLLINHWNIRFCPYVHVFEEGVTTLKALIRQRKRWAEGSIRRYLDYIFPLNSPTRLSLVERFDTLAFTVFFVVPALVFFEGVTEFVCFLVGVPTHGGFLLSLTLAIYLIAQMNFFIAIRMYGQKMPLWKSIERSLQVGFYVYAHWLPCVFLALTQIIFGKKTSTWHPTEHVGHTVI